MRDILSCLLVLSLSQSCFAKAPAPVAKTGVVNVRTKGCQQQLKGDIKNATDLYLVVTDGGDGYACDWANWLEPKLSGPNGELSLTKLKWESATSQWGEVRNGKNAGGQELSVQGKRSTNGIGTHASSVIHYKIPQGYTQFSAIGALDDGGTKQGNASSLKFAVYTSKPNLATTETGDRTPDEAVGGLDTAEGLETKLIASEPMLLSPSNIDVDHLGRIWVCEVVNYRHFANKNNPAREEGDRIAVLEDTDGDGVMDKDTTFYQGRDIDSAHGVCVLGNRVIVSAGENVFNFYDDDGDLKADRKEVMFTGIQGTQHDHGIHSFTFGPDGRLYFNFGNAGKELRTPDGKLVVDIAGNEVIANRKPYQEGMAFRCDLDGSNVDTIGWNFRNNWELCVDSFGGVWQSDNDDDGNKGVRINFVMEYGNYGYKDELTGAGWREPRTGWESTIPERHWHLNDPGVVPNMLQTGAGSPTGILVYEGSLLPERFHNQLIHCDAGPNVVRSYAVSADGAGYQAEINDIVTGARDQWFRPSDVCVAPDGSLIIADWYDPGVGGHRQGDIQRGRLFRVAPEGSNYSVPKVDFSTVEGAIEALKSPNVATRYLAYQKLKESGDSAVGALQAMFESETNPRMKARAFWLLGQVDSVSQDSITTALKSENSDLRIASLRLVRLLNGPVARLASHLASDPSPAVRREAAIALRHLGEDDFAKKARAWGRLAATLPKGDRWYLEALGIAADGLWDECLAAAIKGPDVVAAPGQEPKPFKLDDAVLQRLVWRSRSDDSAKAIVDQIRTVASSKAPTAMENLTSLFRALDFQKQDRTADSVGRLLDTRILTSMNSETRNIVVAESLKRLGTTDFSSNPDAAAALDKALTDLQGTAQFIQLVEQFKLTDRYPEILTLAQAHPDEQVGVEAVRSLLRNKQWNLLSSALRSKDVKSAVATAEVMGNSLESSIAGVLMGVIGDMSVALDVRRECVRAAGKVAYASRELAKLIEAKTIDTELLQTAAAAMHAASSRGTREIAQRLFPLPPVKEGKPLPPLATLVQKTGDPKNGRLIFNTTGTCHKCHIINKIGREIGPNLSEIGSKLSRQAMFESIIYPSAGISHNYEAYSLVLATGTTVNGLITSETDDSISIKGDDAIVRTFKMDEVDEKVKQKISLMPADLQKVMTVQEIVDVVDYLLTLKKK